MNCKEAFQYFLANAPDKIPAWFNHRPIRMNDRTHEMPSKSVIIAKGTDDKTAAKIQEVASSWLGDPNWNLTTGLIDDLNISKEQEYLIQVFENQWEQWWTWREDYKTDIDRAQYFSWKRHYAVSMTAMYRRTLLTIYGTKA